MSNYLSYVMTEAPTQEPVTLTQAKAQLVVDTGFTGDDTYITSLITAARQHCEQVMQRAIYTQSWAAQFDYFPFYEPRNTMAINDRQWNLYSTYWRTYSMNLPWPKVQSITSITYLSQDGLTQNTLDPSTYVLDSMSEPARVTPLYGQYWPYLGTFIPGSVRVNYVTGTWDPDGIDCPQSIMQAMLLLISYWYNHRDAAESNPPKALEFSVDALLTPYKFQTFGLTD